MSLNENYNWIIDGNYISTLEMRIKLADTIILLNIPKEICLKNVYDREKEYINNGVNREDMAKNFDGTVTEEFVSFIENFEKDTLLKIYNILEMYKYKNIKILNDYSELDEFVENIKEYKKI